MCRAAYFSLATGAAIVVAALLLGLWAVGRTLRPLTALTSVAQAIANGEWRDVPEMRRNDEIGVLAHFVQPDDRPSQGDVGWPAGSEARLEEAQRIAHVGYWERDLDTNLLTWSDETFRIYGLVPQSPITFAAWQELIHPEDRQIVIEAVAEALRGGPRYDVEYRVVQPNGEVRIVHSQGNVTRDESGRPHRMFGTVQDVTESKRAEENLARQRATIPRGQMSSHTPIALRRWVSCLPRSPMKSISQLRRQ